MRLCGLVKENPLNIGQPRIGYHTLSEYPIVFSQGYSHREGEGEGMGEGGGGAAGARARGDDAGFYAGLEAHDTLEGALRGGRELPGSWSVVITDVVGSTRAIEEGRYRVVNSLGAACIIAAVNAARSPHDLRGFPFVFGGDGTTLLLPPPFVPRVLPPLAELRTRARENMGLEMRVGCVPMTDLIGAGHSITVGLLDQCKMRKCICRGRYEEMESSSAGFVPVLRGTGLEVAEKWVKGSSKYEVRGLPGRGVSQGAEAGLSLDGIGGRLSRDATPEESQGRQAEKIKQLIDGLVCPLKPFETTKGADGTMLAVLAVPLGSVEQQIETWLEIQRFISSALSDPIPIHPALMAQQGKMGKAGVPQYDVSVVASLSKKSWGSRAWESMKLSAKFNWLMKLMMLCCVPPEAKAEMAEVMATHTDWFKIDGALRMVLNLSAQECVAVLEFLENLHKGGRICYGFHQDRFAQVTCYVPADGGHNHFHMVDVCSGGYCAASVQLKQQLKAANR